MVRDTRELDTIARASLVAGATLLFLTSLLYGSSRPNGLTLIFFREQDAPVLAIGSLVLLGAYLWRDRLRLPLTVSPPRLTAIALAVLATAVALAGTFAVFGNYALSRDELLADFDASFLRRGALVGEIQPEWRQYATALMPQWMLPLSPDVGWMSGYLPGNAALRALFGTMTGPLLAGVSVLALHGTARRLWPADHLGALVPVVLLVGSAQFLIMAMTPYAMAAHLAFNLVWLWCFLRDDRLGDACAWAAGFVATGLHQLLFHPLFVAPFVLNLWIRGERRRALSYAAAYAVIVLFWASYWQIVVGGAAAAETPAAQSGVVYLWDKFTALLENAHVSGIVLMVLNLLRLIAWQHLLLVPLALLAWPAIRRGDGISRPLAAGVLITIVTMTVLLPWQGHGWGYRYLHGLLGSLCLLAAYGWRWIAEPFDEQRKALLATSTAVSLLILLPVHLLQAHNFVAPYRQAQAVITGSAADVVLVDGSGMLFGQDLVRNAHDLSNRPKVMNLNMLDEAQLRALCSSKKVVLFDARDGATMGIRLVQARGGTRQPRRALEALDCGRPL